MLRKWYNYELMIIQHPLNKDELNKLFLKYPNLIKVVVDIEREIMAIGSELHSDEEKILLEHGSKQKNLWGANFLPKSKEVEYYSLINIRPSDGNFGQEIKSSEIREKVKKVISRLFDLPVADSRPESSI